MLVDTDNLNIEDRLVAILAKRADMAVTEAELKQLSGIQGLSFKEAMIRLIRKGLAVKWKSEKFVNYIVLANHASTAYYEEEVTIDSLYQAFGHRCSVVIVKRSIPFVTLEDEEVGKTRSNRYRPTVA